MRGRGMYDRSTEDCIAQLLCSLGRSSLSASSSSLAASVAPGKFILRFAAEMKSVCGLFDTTKCPMSSGLYLCRVRRIPELGTALLLLPARVLLFWLGVGQNSRAAVKHFRMKGDPREFRPRDDGPMKDVVRFHPHRETRKFLSAKWSLI
jgi:hypothetical protein